MYFIRAHRNVTLKIVVAQKSKALDHELRILTVTQDTNMSSTSSTTSGQSAGFSVSSSSF